MLVPVAVAHVRRMKLTAAIRWGCAVVVGAFLEAAVGGAGAAGIWGVATAFTLPWILTRESGCEYAFGLEGVDLVCHSWPYSMRFALLRIRRDPIVSIRRGLAGTAPSIEIESASRRRVTLVCTPEHYERAWETVSSYAAGQQAETDGR